MSTKHFCDVCEKEMTNPAEHDRVKRRLGKVEIEIMRSVAGAWNGGHVCHQCILNVVNTGEPNGTGSLTPPSGPQAR